MVAGSSPVAHLLAWPGIGDARSAMAQQEAVEILPRSYESFARTGEFEPELIHPEAG